MARLLFIISLGHVCAAAADTRDDGVAETRDSVPAAGG